MSFRLTTARSARPGRRRLGAALLALGLLPLAGCAGWEHIELFQDHTLHIDTPANLSTVTLPFAVSWRVDSDYAREHPDARYAVFIDRYPMAPGESMRQVVDSVPQCRGNDGCLDPKRLAAQFGVYLSDGSSSVRVTQIPSGDTGDAAVDSHYATIVRVDEKGERMGEAVWYVGFQVGS